ncbi:hypothetical protein GCM10022247_55480 [Allokutzneria multivorans]|uniref:Uncharacterized protein n=1 Tax=Allokutzneria multivorans TaxID=1142134 RepID=A0ABP7TBL8_9PSEU
MILHRARPAHDGTRKGPQVKPTPAQEPPRSTHPTQPGSAAAPRRKELKAPAVPQLEAQPSPPRKPSRSHPGTPAVPDLEAQRYPTRKRSRTPLEAQPSPDQETQPSPTGSQAAPGWKELKDTNARVRSG